MTKHNIASQAIFWILCLFVFAFWAFMYPAHINYTEQSSLFLYSADYWSQYAFKPAGWSDYTGNFIAQFYINRWIGAALQTLLFTALFITTKQILKKLDFKNNILLIGWLPSIFLFGLQCDYHFTIGYALRFMSPFLFTLLYVSISSKLLRRLLFTLLIVPFFLFTDTYLLGAVYITCILYELFFEKNNWRFSVLLWIPLLFMLPRLWQSIYITPDNKLFQLLSFDLMDGIKYLPYLLLAFLPVCTIIAKILAKNTQWSTAKSILAINVIILMGSGYYLLRKVYNGREEQKFAMDIATIQGDWDKVLKIGSKVQVPDDHTAFFTNLALSMKGELPEKMFSYPQTSDLGLFLPNNGEYFTLRYGSEFYYRIGILNEAIRWLFDSHIINGKGMDYRTLTRLAYWNKHSGYAVAEKYIAILQKTLMYRSWATKLKESEQLRNNNSSSENQKEFYIGGREVISDMARHYDNNQQNNIVKDDLLCCLLLKNDLKRFMNLYNVCYPEPSRSLPKTYQEALLVIADMGNIDISKFPIDKMIAMRFKSFMETNGRGDKELLKKQFGDTWWYYYINSVQSK